MDNTNPSKENLVEHSSRFFERVIEEVFRTRKEAFVISVAEKLRGVVRTAPAEEVVTEQEPWIEVESLSRLRSVVGGRFQNIRKKWLSSGLPLREHRGDKDEGYEIIPEGWVELSNWILKQGYDARLTPDKTGCVLELRKRSSD